MSEALVFIQANWKDMLEFVLALLGAFSILAKITPNKKDDAILDTILRVVHFFGLTKAQKISK